MIKVVLLFLVPLFGVGDEIGFIKPQIRGLNYTKAEGELIISWSGESKNRESDQIEVYDSQGNRLSSVKVLAAVEGAEKVGIWDVSARRDKRIAVAADFVNNSGIAAGLLYFDFNGRLLSATALALSREIRLIALDDDLSVWALGMGAGEHNPSEVSLLFNYDSKGQLRKELIKRAQFSADAEMLQEGPGVGSPAMGITADAIWIWLAGSTELVTIQKSDFSVTRTITGLPDPPASGSRELARLVRLPSGALIGEFSERDRAAWYSHYKWSPESRSWELIVPNDCGNHFLIGTLNGVSAFVGFGSKAICTARM